jgi:RNA polymerase sigma factor (sigma-70 family)
MGNGQLPTVLGFIRKLQEQEQLAPWSDSQLLDRFLDSRDERAFAALLQRHGPLVLNICRRVLPSSADAEDAFQATFLIFVRKAHSIAKRASLASWLHGVAYRVALRARKEAARRRARQRRLPVPAAPDAFQEVVLQDLRTMLDEEVLHLPEVYRVPFVLCYLQGRTNEESAQLLGCPIGTVQSRLARARVILRGRLARRGLLLSAGLVTTMLPGRAQAMALPGRLVQSTLQAALAVTDQNVSAAVVSSAVAELTQGALQTMFRTKLSIVTTLLMAVLSVSAAVTVGALCARAGKSGEDQSGRATAGASQGHSTSQPKTSNDDVNQDRDHERIQGTWKVVSAQTNGEKEKLRFKLYRWTFQGNEVSTLWVRDDDTTGGGKSSFRLEPTKDPRELTISGPNLMIRAIYKLQGDTLSISYFGRPEKERPRSFNAARAGGGGLPVVVWVLQRQK